MGHFKRLSPDELAYNKQFITNGWLQYLQSVIKSGNRQDINRANVSYLKATASLYKVPAYDRYPPPWPHYSGVQFGIGDEFDKMMDRLVILMDDYTMTVDGQDQYALRLLKEHVDALVNYLENLETAKKAKSLSNIQQTEKEFLSEKVPKDVADNIASYLTGKKGSLGAQMSKLRVDVGKSGVPLNGGKKRRSSSKNGKKKTKKLRSKKTKTRRA